MNKFLNPTLTTEIDQFGKFNKTSNRSLKFEFTTGRISYILINVASDNILNKFYR